MKSRWLAPLLSKNELAGDRLQKHFLNFIVKVLDRFLCLDVNIVNVETLGRRQVVRQLVLVQPFRGSNPFAPDKLFFQKTRRLKPRLHRQNPPPRVKSVRPADIVCIDAVSTVCPRL